MRIRKIYVGLLLSSLFILQVSAQDEKKTPLEIADGLYSRYEFVDAAKAYQKLVRGVKTDNYIYLQLADCYYNIFNTVEAAKYYGKALEKEPNLDSELYYRYAQMLKASGRYETANAVMKKFAERVPEDQRAISFMREPDYIPRLREQEELFTYEESGINDMKGSDFGAFLTSGDTLYFASTRTTKRDPKTYGWNDQPYLDIYQARYKSIEDPLYDVEEVSELNTKYHDGPATVTGDGKTMYFATESFREGKFTKNKQKLLKLGKVSLFRATKKKGKWSNIEPVPFNGSDYSVSNPSVSKDGSTLYFSSDMPGTMGETDIWKVEIDDEGNYGTPVNMGSQVNTEGRESFPFISEEGKLYFASDSRKGFGGLDVYVVDLAIPQAEPKNLGAPINTAKDDFAFSFYPSKDIGFFSTNRVGRDDIYKAIPICNSEMYVTVTDKQNGQILANSKVDIFDDRKNLIETKYSDERGIVEYVVDCGKFFNLQVSKEDYESKSIEVPLNRKGGRQLINVALNPIEVIVLKEEILLGDIHFEFDRFNITQQGAFELDKLVQVMKRNPQMRIKVGSHTDTQGSPTYNQKLSENRAKTTVQYLLSKGIESYRLESEGFGASRPKINCGGDCTEAQHAINRRSEFEILK
ncbi:OmpA family protein [Myroides indicus]|uniref:WD40 repeat protein n=1 Tax=Myroides indicus TaxID=1323422 RepID=A0A4R7F3J1_9FLAO|nr:OmpA family protein [Myroides indicus]TDS57891.1 WD40 repeat protein [Myroides indicus]